MQEKILVIDDDRELLKLLTQCMPEEFRVTTAISGREGLKELEQDQFALIILDVMLPGADGISVLQKIREKYNMPVIMLTAKDSIDDKMNGLYTGADDYITKPFDMKELVARVHSQIRRSTVLNTSPRGNEVLDFGSMSIDQDSKCVRLAGEEIFLTGKEFDLLYFLACSPGKVYTKQQIYVEVWGDVYVYDDDNIMAVISRIRKKIEKNPSRPEYIQTIRGIGYRFMSQTR